jgi:hypothetical protein
MELTLIKVETRKFALEIATDYLKNLSCNSEQSAPVDAKKIGEFLEEAGITIKPSEMSEMLNELMFGKNKIANFKIEMLFPSSSENGCHFRILKDSELA